MRKLLKSIGRGIIFIALVLCSMYGVSRVVEASDSHIQDRVVRLYGDAGSCSGIAITAPSGAQYVLTAAHCHPLVKDGIIMAELEDGRTVILHFVEESKTSDLMLLTAEFLPFGIDIADSVERHEHLKTITHGGAAKSYRTDGEAVDYKIISFIESQITTPEELAACTAMPKHTAIPDWFGQILCATTEDALRSTAASIPGSSGGPLLNSSGRLVGIVSAGDGKFSYYVKLSDIKDFLKAR